MNSTSFFSQMFILGLFRRNCRFGEVVAFGRPVVCQSTDPVTFCCRMLEVNWTTKQSPPTLSCSFTHVIRSIFLFSRSPFAVATLRPIGAGRNAKPAHTHHPCSFEFSQSSLGTFSHFFPRDANRTTFHFFAVARRSHIDRAHSQKHKIPK